MGNFFKSFGKGVLYLLVLPFLLVILAIYAVVGLFVFIFEGIKAIFLFFSGRSLFDDLPEDKKAKEIIASLSQPKAEATLAAQNETASVATTNPSQTTTDASIYNNPQEVSEDPFYVPEYLKTTPHVEEEENSEEQPQEEISSDETEVSYIHTTRINTDEEPREPSYNQEDGNDNFDI